MTIIKIIKRLILILSFFSYLLSPSFINAEVIERVVAIVNDEVILLSELERAYQTAVNSNEKKTKLEVLNEMINKLLLLQEAKKFKLMRFPVPPGEQHEEEKIIKEYIERRIKAFIHIPFEEIESYYLKNKNLFGDKEFYEVRDEIEGYLIRERLKKKLSEHIQELRKKSYIRIQLED